MTTLTGSDRLTVQQRALAERTKLSTPQRIAQEERMGRIARPDEHDPRRFVPTSAGTAAAEDDALPAHLSKGDPADSLYRDEAASASMRLEAVTWPRILYPPIKSPRTVTMDACTAHGTLQRWTVSKSRDDFATWRDALQTRWGDLYPHDASGSRMPRERGIRRLDEPAARPPEVFDQGDADLDLMAVLSEDGLR